MQNAYGVYQLFKNNNYFFLSQKQKMHTKTTIHVRTRFRDSVLSTASDARAFLNRRCSRVLMLLFQASNII